MCKGLEAPPACHLVWLAYPVIIQIGRAWANLGFPEIRPQMINKLKTFKPHLKLEIKLDPKSSRGFFQSRG